MSESLTVEQMEALIRQPDAVEQLLALAQPKTVGDLRHIMSVVSQMANADLPEVGATVVEHEAVDDNVRATIVKPAGDGPFPVLCFYHGGAWVCGSSRDYRKLHLRIAEQGILVISIDYRLAPEHPFPAGFLDCVAGYRWAVANCRRWGGDPARIAVGGDSAGGNLSAAVACALHGEPDAPRATALIYGAFYFGPHVGTAEADVESSGGDGEDDIAAIAYLGENFDELVSDPRVSPIQAGDRFPPSHIVVGAQDPLVRHAEALVDELKKHDVPHDYHVDPGMPHGYFQFEMLPLCRPAIDRMCAWLKQRLA